MRKILIFICILCAPFSVVLASPVAEFESKIKDLENKLTDAVNGDKGCEERTSEAGKQCKELNSPEMQTALGLGQQILQTLTTTTPEAACGGFAKMLTALQGGLAGYQMYCGTAHGDCGQVCDDARMAASKCERDGERLERDIQNAIDTLPAGDPSIEALNKLKSQAYKAASSCDNLGDSISEDRRTCQGYAQNLGSGTQGAMVALQGLVQLQQCKKQAGSQLQTFCQQYPTVSFCQTNNLASEDCSNSAVASSNLVCICRANPLDSRCGAADLNSRTTAGTSSSQYSEGGGIDGKASSGGSAFPVGDPGAFDSSDEIMPGQNRGGDQAQALARGSAGGANLSGGGGGGSGGPGKQEGGARAGSGMNPKILSGFIGGGGGAAGSGGRFGFGDGDGDDKGRQRPSLKDSKYQQYVKGGEFDPKRHPGSIGPDGISGPNSLSNFEKVKLRYQNDLITANQRRGN